MACAAVLVSFANAHAQTEVLPEVFVTANRIGQELDSVLSEVDVLKKTDLENMGNANLTQALSKLPGFQGISYGRNAVYLRGSESRMTAVYVEGIRIESHDGLQLGGGAPWEMLPLEMVDRLEVVKGPASAMYGSDAMGGVVQLFGKRATANDRPSLTQAFGSFGLKQTTGQISGKKQAFDYALVLSVSSSDGYNTRPDIVHTPSKESSSKQIGMVKLGYDLNKFDRLEWIYLDSRQSYLTAPGNYSGGTSDISNHNQIMANGVQWQHGWDDKNISRFRLNSALVASDSNAPNADPNTGNSDLPWKYKTKSKNYSLDHELLSEAGLFNFLIERKEDQFKADGNQYVGGWEANAPVDSSRSQNAIGLSYNLHSNRHIVNAAFRNDRYSNFEPHSSYSLSYGYEATHDWVLSASLANGFKAPSLEEMYGKYGSVSLLPETNISRELALQYNRYPNKFRVSLFDNSVNDLISARPMSYVACPACYYNVGKASIKGISLSGQTKIMDVNVQTNLDLLDPMDQIKHKQLSLRSKQNFRIAADKPFATSQMGIEYQYLGKRFDDSDNTVVLPAYGLVNLWIKTPISSDWKWFNRVDNLTSQKYQQLNCTPDICKFASPGVTFFTAIQWQPK